jgi:hypothetical protein
MKKYVVLATGTKVSFSTGVPSAEDLAIALPRIARFSGNGSEWFPVALHTFVVCDLLPGPLKFYGLLHDGPEIVGSDVPSPVKSPVTRRREEVIFQRMIAASGLRQLTTEEEHLLKWADTAALLAEIYTYGPPALRADYPRRAPNVERLIMAYARQYPPMDCITRGGKCGQEFLRRYNAYLAYALTTRQAGITPAPESTS